MAMGQNLRNLFGDDYPPKVVYFKGFWDVHRGTGVLTHCQMLLFVFLVFFALALFGLTILGLAGTSFHFVAP